MDDSYNGIFFHRSEKNEWARTTCINLGNPSRQRWIKNEVAWRYNWYDTINIMFQNRQNNSWYLGDTSIHSKIINTHEDRMHPKFSVVVTCGLGGRQGQDWSGDKQLSACSVWNVWCLRQSDWYKSIHYSFFCAFLIYTRYFIIKHLKEREKKVNIRKMNSESSEKVNLQYSSTIVGRRVSRLLLCGLLGR